ncbi:MAG: hypothetical protein DRP59_07795 [Spirochaetes bacterium]|nr:MAG: hypothetical protein DRP59_07795 [Spirochaetota bacterium]
MYIVIDESARLLHEIENAEIKPYSNLVFDMKKVVSIRAGEIGIIIRISEKVKKAGGCISLMNLPQLIMEILQLPGFDHYFEIDSVNKAAHNCTNHEDMEQLLRIDASNVHKENNR